MTDKPDIVERLRHPNIIVDPQRQELCVDANHAALCLEAADEIERLRTEAAKLVDENNHLWEETDKLRDVLTELRTYIGQRTFNRAKAVQYIDAATQKTPTPIKEPGS